jgi:antitoxin HicB
MNSMGYFAKFEPAAEGGFVITFPDLPEAVSEADDMKSALSNASEILDLCLLERINSGDLIPIATQIDDGVWIEPSGTTQATMISKRFESSPIRAS